MGRTKLFMLIMLLTLLPTLAIAGPGKPKGATVTYSDTDTLDVPILKQGGVQVQNDKLAVAVATTGNITLSGEQTIDGVLTSASRVLVWQQSTPAQNGVYVSASGSWTRATDADADSEYTDHWEIYVDGGDTYATHTFKLATINVTVGSSTITFVDNQAAGGPLAITKDPDTGKIADTNVLPWPATFTTTPGAGVCTQPQHTLLDDAQLEKARPAWCPGGNGSNAITELYIDKIDQVCVDGGDCRTLPEGRSGTLNIIAGTNLTASIDDDGDVIEVTLNASLTGGSKSLWIPASAMTVSGTCTSLEPADVTLLSNGPKQATIIPADDGSCSVEFSWAFTTVDGWNAGTIQVQLVAFSTSNQNTQVLEIDWAGQCRADGAQLAAHSTTGEQATSVTFGNQTNDLQISAASSAITLNGSCNATSGIFMRGQVDATATTVGTIANVHVLGIKVIYGGS